MAEGKGKVVALAVVMPLVAVSAVWSRFYARRLRNTRLGVDDWLTLAGTILVIGMGIAQLVGATAGDLGQAIPVGPHGEPVIGHRTVVFEQTEWAFQIIEKLAFGIIKLAVLTFYQRIFTGKTFNIAAWSMIAVVIAWATSFFFATICECHPPSAAWSTSRQALFKQCIKTVDMLLGFAISDVVTDVMILALPLPMVWQLQLSRKKRIALSGVFLLGGLTVLAGVARVVFFYKAARHHTASNIAVNTAPTIYWSLIEASLAIVSASLPTIRSLFRGVSPESIIGSIRSAFSLHSIKDRISPPGTKVYGKSQGHDKLDDSSVVGLATSSTSSRGATQLPEYEVHAESLPMKNIRESITVPENRIRVQNDFGADSNV